LSNQKPEGGDADTGYGAETGVKWIAHDKCTISADYKLRN